MKRLSVLFLAAVSFAAASCVGEVLRGPGEIAVDRSDFVPVEFRAVIEQLDPGTKTVMDGDVEAKVRDLLWEPGDEVLLTSGFYSHFGILENIEGEPSAASTFGGAFSIDFDSFTAIYPASIVDTTKVYGPDWDYANEHGISTSGIYIELPSEQKYCENGVASGAFPMIARYNRNSGDRELAFKNLCSVLVLKLRSDVEGLRVNSIRVRARSSEGSSSYAQLSGTYRISRTDPDPLMYYYQEDKKNEYVELDCMDGNGEGVNINTADPVYFHVVIPPGDYYGFMLEVYTDAGRKVAFSKAEDVSIDRGRRYFSADTVPLELTINDLSNEGTANSYIVPAMGSYKFKADVKGNSNEPVGDIKSARVLWQTKMTDKAPSPNEVISDVSLEEDYVMFNANKNGNAGIAVCDADGNILWSWHIWIVDGYDAHASAQTYYNGAGIFMDRNLGALVATSSSDNTSRGFQYYWGRKDPFGGDRYYVPDNQVFPWLYSYQFTTVKPDIEYTVRNPMMHIDSYWGDDYSIVRNDWLYKQTEDRKQVDTLRWNAASKTMYDPCPPGWKVPGRVYSRAAGTTSVDCSNQDKDDYGINLSGVLADDASVWYPKGSYWIGSAYTGTSYYSDSQISTSAGYQTFGGGWLSLGNMSAGLSNCHFVRCCDERGVPSVGRTDVSDVKTNAATCYAEVLSDGGFDITDTGFIVSSDSWWLDDSQIFKYIKDKPESDFFMISNGLNKESFTAAVSDLNHYTTYYVRAYAANQIGIGLGDMVEFKTLLGGGNEGLERGDDIQW